jgi:hypothetical protein
VLWLRENASLAVCAIGLSQFSDGLKGLYRLVRTIDQPDLERVVGRLKRASAPFAAMIAKKATAVPPTISMK